MVGRLIVLMLTQSFYGREDPSLTARLLTELPGILNWSLHGYRRLRQRGYRNNTEAIRPVNEARFEARWKLGQLLAQAEREQLDGLKRGKASPLSRTGTTGFRAYLRDLSLNKNRANECERIGAIPAEANVNGWGPLNPRAPQSTSGRRTIKELPVWETGSVELG